MVLPTRTPAVAGGPDNAAHVTGMSIVYVVSENLETTEYRGTSRPQLVTASLGNAYQYAKNFGYGKQESVYEIDTDTTPNEAEAKHGSYWYRNKVVGHHRNGVGAQWGVIPDGFEELTDTEKQRLETLRRALGKDLPVGDEPQETELTNSHQYAVLWAPYDGSIAARRVKDVPQIIGIRDICLDTTNDIAIEHTRSWARNVIEQVRELNPNLGRCGYTVVADSVPFRLSYDTATWLEPNNAGTESPEEDRQALLDEYTDLAKRAGIL